MPKERPKTKWEEWNKLQLERIFGGYRRHSEGQPSARAPPRVKDKMPEESELLEELLKGYEDKIKCPFTYMDRQLVTECCGHVSIVVMKCDGYSPVCGTRKDYIKAKRDEALARIKERGKGESKE